MEQTKGRRTLEVLTVVLKVLITIAYLVITIFLGIVEVSEINATVNNPDANNIGMVFAFVIIIMGVIAYGVVVFISLIGLIISLCNKYSENRKKHIIFFVLGIIVPILTEGLLILVGMQFV